MRLRLMNCVRLMVEIGSSSEVDLNKHLRTDCVRLLEDNWPPDKVDDELVGGLMILVRSDGVSVSVGEGCYEWTCLFVSSSLAPGDEDGDDAVDMAEVRLV